jgi:hypothetical protein
VARMGEERKVYKVLVGKPEGKSALGRPRRRWEDGIRMDLMEIGLGCGLDSTGSGQGPAAGCCECGDEPSGSYATELVSQLATYVLDQMVVSVHSLWLSSLCKLTTVQKYSCEGCSNFSMCMGFEVSLR